MRTTLRSLIFAALLASSGLVWAGDSQEDDAAGIDNKAKAAYFVLKSSGYVLAVNVVENGDVYYHMNAPASHSWMGVGFADNMTNTRMLISYRSANGHNLTNSCRMAHGHHEPEYDPDCVVDNVDNDKYAPFANTLSPDGLLIAHAVCRNCSSWAGGFIDIKNENQPFIYALGPNKTLLSDSPSADLRVHQIYGRFNLDMTVATNYTGDYGRVPAPQDPALAVGEGFWAFASYFSSSAYGTGTLADWSPTAHAVFMCLAFLLIIPLGAVSLRLVRKWMFHAATEAVGVGFVIIGFGFAIYTSRLYNKSRNFNSAHQILGLFIFSCLFLQMGLGITHKFIVMRAGTYTPMGKIHRFLGMSIMALALVNGGLGFDFAKNGNSNVTYGSVVGAMFIIFGVLALLIFFYNRKHVYKPDQDTFGTTGYGKDPPAEYEMHNAPFAHMGHVQTPRTPFFGDPRWNDDPENYRSHLVRQESFYTDTPASENKEDPMRTKWEAVRVD